MAPAKKRNEHNAYRAKCDTTKKAAHCMLCFSVVSLFYVFVSRIICKNMSFFKINLGWGGNERCTYLNCPFFLLVSHL